MADQAVVGFCAFFDQRERTGRLTNL